MADSAKKAKKKSELKDLERELSRIKFFKKVYPKFNQKIANKKIKANKKDMMDILKAMYGSEDKIPDARKKFLGL